MAKICVIGGANIDICGYSEKPLAEYDSNPGIITLQSGGVGRNIASICAMLGQSVEFVTCFHDDYFGKALKQDCEQLHLDCRKSKLVKEGSSSIYLAILDENHDMKLALNDMRVLDYMDQSMLDPVIQDLDVDDIVVIDANIKEEMIGYLMEHVPCRIVSDPVSVHKCYKLKPYLSKLAIFKPNQFEAKYLSGIEIVDTQTAKTSVEYFLNQGIQEVMISMAEKGVLLGYQDQVYWLRHKKIEIENATGGGDSFLATYLTSRLLNKTPIEAARHALTAAVLTISNNAVKNKQLNLELIAKNIKEMEIEEKKL